MVLCTGPFPAPCIVESQKYWPDVVRWIKCLSAFRARLARKNCRPKYESPAKLVVRRSWSEVDAMLHMLHLPWNDKRERERKKKERIRIARYDPLISTGRLKNKSTVAAWITVQYKCYEILENAWKYMKILQGSCDISWKLISVVSSKHSKLICSSSVVMSQVASILGQKPTEMLRCDFCNVWTIQREVLPEIETLVSPKSEVNKGRTWSNRSISFLASKEIY